VVAEEALIKDGWRVEYYTYRLTVAQQIADVDTDQVRQIRNSPGSS